MQSAGCPLVIVSVIMPGAYCRSAIGPVMDKINIAESTAIAKSEDMLRGTRTVYYC